MQYLKHGAIIASPLFYPSEPLAIIHAVTKQIWDVVGWKKWLLLSDKSEWVTFPDFDLLQSNPKLWNYSVLDFQWTERMNEDSWILISKREVGQWITLKDKVLWALLMEESNEWDFVTDWALLRALDCWIVEETSYLWALDYLKKHYGAADNLKLQFGKYENALRESWKVEEAVYQIRDMTKWVMIALNPNDFLSTLKEEENNEESTIPIAWWIIPQWI